MIIFCYIVFAIVLISLRVLLVIGVKNEVEYRETSSKKLWIVLTALIGLIAAICFVAFTVKKEKNPKAKFVALMFGGLIIFGVVFGAFVYPAAIEKAEQEGITSFRQFKDEVVYFKNDDGEYVVYDKMGNEYNLEQYLNDELKYYTKDGDEYVSYNYGETGSYGIKNVETGEEIPFGYMGDKDYFIGEDGYLYIYDDDLLMVEYSIYSDDETMESVYYNKDGMLLYYTSSCNWDKDGNMILNEMCDEKDFKYEDIPKSEINWLTLKEKEELNNFEE